jgi:hypothetical protein
LPNSLQETDQPLHLLETELFMDLDAEVILGLCIGAELGTPLRQCPSLSRFHERSSKPTASLFWNNEPSLDEGHRRAAGPFREFAQPNLNKPDWALSFERYDKNSPTAGIREDLSDFPVTTLAAIRPKVNSQGTVRGH